MKIEVINRPAKLWRVGPSGLWYDQDGHETRLIHQLKEGHARALPMGPHPVFRDQGRRWISVTDTLAALRNWFSLADMHELAPKGFVVEEIEVTAYRRLHFENFSHEAYCVEDMVGFRTLSPFAAFEEIPA